MKKVIVNSDGSCHENCQFANGCIVDPEANFCKDALFYDCWQATFTCPGMGKEMIKIVEEKVRSETKS